MLLLSFDKVHYVKKNVFSVYQTLPYRVRKKELAFLQYQVVCHLDLLSFGSTSFDVIKLSDFCSDEKKLSRVPSKKIIANIYAMLQSYFDSFQPAEYLIDFSYDNYLSHSVINKITKL